MEDSPSIESSVEIESDVDGHYRSFYENAVEGFYRTTMAGEYLRANLALASLYGYDSVDQLVEDSKFSARRLYVKSGRRSEFISTMEEKEAVTRFESEVFRRDGSTIWISESARVIRDSEGKILFFEGTVTDITRQKDAELALLESRIELENRVKERTAELRANVERMDRLIENVPGMVYQVHLDHDGTQSFRFVNERVIDLYGVTPEDVTSGRCDIIKMVHPDDEESLILSMKEAAASMKPWQWVGKMISAQGETKWVHCQSRPDAQADGTSLWDGVIIDVTELHTTKNALRRTEQHHSAILEASPDGILTIDSTGRILAINPAAERILGALEKAVVGKSMGQIFSDVSRSASQDVPEGSFALLQDRTFIGKCSELSALRSDGSNFPVELTFSPISVDGETHFTVNMRDIGTRKRFEQQLRVSRDEAHRANKAKSEFLSRMSHELRTPLNAILGFSQLLLRRETDAKKSEKVEFIRRAGNHLLGLINEILDLARIEAGKLCCSIEEVSTARILEEVAGFSQPLADEKGVTLSVENNESSDFGILADQQRLKQILLNLVANAIKYNREGGEVRVFCESSDGSRVKLSVCDTGNGIPKEKMRDLFTPFERIGAENSDVEGTGIGLALSQSLAQLMGSEIEVESVVGEGSCFSLSLPLANAKEIESANRSELYGVRGANSTREAGSGFSHRLLYIEDNPVNLRLIENLIEETPGWDLLTAKNGQSGIEIATETVPDLIFLDLHLPDINGDKVLTKLRQNPALADTQIVIITADAMNQASDRFADSGADHFLTKPIQLAQVCDLIEAVATEREGLVS